MTLRPGSANDNRPGRGHRLRRTGSVDVAKMYGYLHIDVAEVTDYAADLPNVVHTENTLYTCSADSLRLIQERIQEKRLNRGRTYEPRTFLERTNWGAA